MTKISCIVLLAVCCAAVGAVVAPIGSSDIKMGAEVEFANAGVSLAVPNGFEFQPLTEAYDVARAVLMTGDNKAAQAVSLAAYPIMEKATADQFADAVTAEVQKNIAVSGFVVMKKATMLVAGQEAQVRLLSYSFRGVKTMTARAFFIRDGKGGNPAGNIRICYSLAVESSADRQGTLMPIFAAVIKSIKFTDIRRPMTMAVDELAAPLKEYKLGYEVRPPKNWYVSITPSGAEMGQTDYVMGGLPMPVVRVIVGDAGAHGSAKDVARKSLDDFRKAVSSSGREMKVVSEGQAVLAGKGGYQYVVELLPARTASTATTQEAVPTVIVQRTVVNADGAPGEQRSYSLRLYAQTDKPETAEAILDKVADGFGLSPSATTATSPAGIGK